LAGGLGGLVVVSVVLLVTWRLGSADVPRPRPILPMVEGRPFPTSDEPRAPAQPIVCHMPSLPITLGEQLRVPGSATQPDLFDVVRPEGLSGADVRRVINAHVGSVRACYEAEVSRTPSLTGKITVAWVVEPSGEVSSVTLAGTTLNNTPVEACVLREVHAWHFPVSAASTHVTGYPFHFGLSG
jgi:hypothetical protein